MTSISHLELSATVYEDSKAVKGLLNMEMMPDRFHPLSPSSFLLAFLSEGEEAREYSKSVAGWGSGGDQWRAVPLRRAELNKRAPWSAFEMG